jgi:starvation-inducible DNA-binding protein
VQPSTRIEDVANPWGGDVLVDMRDPALAGLGETPDDPQHWGDHEVQNPSWDKVGGRTRQRKKNKNGKTRGTGPSKRPKNVSLGDVYRTINEGRTQEAARRVRGLAVSELTDELKTTLANVISVYLRAHGYHWNVEGSDFAQYHALFETIYSDIYESIDPTAENIRELGTTPGTGVERIAELAMVPEPARISNDARSLAVDLLDANQFLVEEWKRVFDVADDADEQGIANFAAERIDMHEKWVWQLKASTR